MKQTKPYPTPRGLARLKRQLSEEGITHQVVADECEPAVRKQHVTNVLAGRWRSANVIAAAERLRKRRRPATPAEILNQAELALHRAERLTGGVRG